MYESILSTAVAYILLCKLIKVNIISHFFTNIFQKKYISAVKFHMDFEKNMSFHLISKSLSVWNKSEKSNQNL